MRHPAGDSALRLREKLGAPSSYWAQRRGLWLYPAWGLRFDVVGDEVEGLYVVLRREGFVIAPVPVRWEPFSGQFTTPSHTVPASRLSTRRSLETALLGPDEVEETAGETILSWQREGWTLEAAAHPDGSLMYLSARRG